MSATASDLPARLDGEALARLGSLLVATGGALAEATTALAALPAWPGAAGSAFAAEVARQERACATAGQAHGAAGRAVLGHALLLVRVRAQAQRHADDLAVAEHRTRAWAAAGAGAATSGAAPSPDPGAEQRRAATAALAALAREVAESGSAAAAALRAATEAAPPPPGVGDLLLDDVRARAASAGTGAAEAVLGALALGAGLLGLPARLRRGDTGPPRALAAAARAAVEHPGATAAAALDLPTWRSDPSRAAGRLAPDVLVGVLTGGTAGAGAAARRAAAGAGGAAGWRGHGLALDAAEHALVLALHRRAAQAEPAVTASLRASASATGHELVGLADAVKSQDSLSRKVADPSQRGGAGVPEAVGRVNDALRYTVLVPAGTYRAGADAVVADLSARGFELVGLKNRWEHPMPYSGINSTWRDPTSGVLLEVQLHTPDSWAANKATRAEYEERRSPMTTPERAQEIHEQERVVWDQVPVPPEAGQLTPERYGLRPVTWRGALDALVPPQPSPQRPAVVQA